VYWQTAALATVRAFVTWLDRWLAGESTARQAPDLTAGYASKPRATVNHVPPAAPEHVSALVHLVPVGMPPNATDPHKAWIYTPTRSQRAVIQITVEERLHDRRWLVYNLYQGP
jgi:hypothetical protein